MDTNRTATFYYACVNGSVGILQKRGKYSYLPSLTLFETELHIYMKNTHFLYITLVVGTSHGIFIWKNT